MLSTRNSQAEERLERIGRPKSLVEIEMSQAETGERFTGLKEAFTNLGGAWNRRTNWKKTRCRIKTGERRLPQRERRRRSTTASA